MTNEQIRIAIAEKCGWVEIKGPWHSLTGKHPEKLSSMGNCYRNDIPNYPEDLNAIHEAEKLLFGEQLVDYGIKLVRLTDSYGVNGSAHWGKLAHAIAHQRAEAFLRTFGLWKENSNG